MLATEIAERAGLVAAALPLAGISSAPSDISRMHQAHRAICTKRAMVRIVLLRVRTDQRAGGFRAAERQRFHGTEEQARDKLQVQALAEQAASPLAAGAGQGPHRHNGVGAG